MVGMRGEGREVNTSTAKMSIIHWSVVFIVLVQSRNSDVKYLNIECQHFFESVQSAQLSP